MLNTEKEKKRKSTNVRSRRALLARAVSFGAAEKAFERWQTTTLMKVRGSSSRFALRLHCSEEVASPHFRRRSRKCRGRCGWSNERTKAEARHAPPFAIVAAAERAPSHSRGRCSWWNINREEKKKKDRKLGLEKRVFESL